MGEMSISRAITWLADERPGAPSLRCGDEVLTRRAVDEATNRIARRWLAGGVGVDDVVAVSPSSPVDLVLATVAAWKAGATPLLLPPGLSTDERRALLALSGPGWLVEGPVDRSADLSAAPLPDLASSCWRASASSGGLGPAAVVRSRDAARVDPTDVSAPHLPRDAVQLVGGSLDDSVTFDCAMRGLVAGHELVLMDSFDPEQWLRLVAEHRVTWALVHPAQMAQIARVADRSAYDVASLQTVLHPGADCPGWLVRDWAGWLGPERLVELPDALSDAI